MNEKVQIQFSPVNCYIISDTTPEMEKVLFESLAFQAENYFYAPQYQSGVWDGYHRLYSVKGKSFRTGLLERAEEVLTSAGYIVEVLNKPAPTIFQQRSNTYKLRQPYQEEAVKQALFHRFGIIKAPMRSGKTLMSIAITDSERKFPMVFFVRSCALAIQTVKKFRLFLPDITVGMVGDGELSIGDVTVITIQSAYSAYNKKLDEKFSSKEKDVENKIAVRKIIETAEEVFYDEVHEASGASSKFILGKCVTANLKIGFSATPFEDEAADMLVEEASGKVIFTVGFSELIRQGYLLRPTIYIYKLPPIVADGNYQSVYKQGVTDNLFLRELIKKIVTTLNNIGHSVVIQTEYRNHTKELANFLGCDFLIGNEKKEKREKILQKIQDKEILCLVSTIVEQGIDISSLNYSVNLVGGMRYIPTFQRIRSITPDEGKQTAGVIDFYFQSKFLQKHSKRRLKVYKSEPEFVIVERDVSKKKIEEIV